MMRLMLRTSLVTALAIPGLLVLVAACATAVPVAPPPDLPTDLDRTLAADQAIPWSATRQLTWADFQGVVPASPGQDAARTAYTLPHGARCIGETFEFQVVAAFLPRQSWVRPEVVADPDESRRALDHEQMHFNLTEVHARRMRRYFADLYDPCGKSEDELSTLADRFVREEAAAQARYDEETRHGRDAEAQARWDRQVAADLAALARYAKKDSGSHLEMTPGVFISSRAR